jgi:hypothetical protein
VKEALSEKEACQRELEEAKKAAKTVVDQRERESEVNEEVDLHRARAKAFFESDERAKARLNGWEPDNNYDIWTKVDGNETLSARYSIGQFVSRSFSEKIERHALLLCTHFDLVGIPKFKANRSVLQAGFREAFRKSQLPAGGSVVLSYPTLPSATQPPFVRSVPPTRHLVAVEYFIVPTKGWIHLRQKKTDNF